MFYKKLLFIVCTLVLTSHISAAAQTTRSTWKIAKRIALVYAGMIVGCTAITHGFCVDGSFIQQKTDASIKNHPLVEQQLVEALKYDSYDSFKRELQRYWKPVTSQHSNLKDATGELFKALTASRK